HLSERASASARPSRVGKKTSTKQRENQMKRIAPGLFIVLSGIALNAQAIDFWHSNTVWAGQGQCSAVFSFDSGMEEIKNLQVSVAAVNKAGKRVAAGDLQIARFGQSSADRYA